MTANERDLNTRATVKRLDRARFDSSVQESIDAILRNQSPVAPSWRRRTSPQYHYCWLRDGSFSAFALDRAGEHEASARYHAWVNDAIGGISGIIDDVIEKMLRGEELDPTNMPPARFALDGTSVIDDWPNFQIDGYGTWLWSLGQHLLESPVSTRCRRIGAVQLPGPRRYLAIVRVDSLLRRVGRERYGAPHVDTGLRVRRAHHGGAIS